MSNRPKILEFAARIFARKPWRLPLLVFGVAALGTAAYCMFGPEIYETSGFVSLRNEQIEGAASESESFLAAIRDPHTIERTAARLGARGTAREISRRYRLRISAFAKTNASVRIQVRGSTAQFVREWLPAFIEEYVTVQTSADRVEEIAKPELRIITAAHQVAPQTNRIVAAMIAATFILTLAIRLIVPRLLPHLISGEQIEERFGVPCFGLLPRIVARHADPTTNTAALLDEVSCEGAFAPMAQNDQLGRVIIVTSACAGHGKTFVAALLARACANENLRTLLIDASRSKNLHRFFGLRAGPGLREYLSDHGAAGGGAAADHFCRVTRSTMLDVMTAGSYSVAASSSDNLSLRDVFARLLPDLEKKYDRIIIDGPAISECESFFPDGMDQCTIAVVVPSAGSFAPATLKMVRTVLAKRPRHCGCVINGVELGAVGAPEIGRRAASLASHEGWPVPIAG